MGEAELAVIALHRAVEMAAACSDQLTTSTVFPGFVASKRRDLRELRDGYEHIEERALGLLKGLADEKAAEIFAFGSLLSEERLEYGKWSLGIQAEATRLIIDTRNYLVAVWHELIAKSLNPEQRPPRASFLQASGQGLLGLGRRIRRKLRAATRRSGSARRWEVRDPAVLEISTPPSSPDDPSPSG